MPNYRIRLDVFTEWRFPPPHTHKCLSRVRVSCAPRCSKTNCKGRYRSFRKYCVREEQLSELFDTIYERLQMPTQVGFLNNRGCHMVVQKSNCLYVVDFDGLKEMRVKSFQNRDSPQYLLNVLYFPCNQIPYAEPAASMPLPVLVCRPSALLQEKYLSRTSEKGGNKKHDASNNKRFGRRFYSGHFRDTLMLQIERLLRDQCLAKGNKRTKGGFYCHRLT